MDASRERVLLASVVVAGLVLVSWVVPAAAADCALNAPASVRVGTTQVITGSGFPASSAVDVELTVEGGNPDALSVQSSQSGAFEITLTPEAIDIGHTTVVAKAGTTCTATVDFTVVGANATLLPEPTAAPAGGSSGGGKAPRTDSAAALAELRASPPTAWIVGILSLLIGIAGVVATRPARGR
jgi:hypothetical protein